MFSYTSAGHQYVVVVGVGGVVVDGYSAHTNRSDATNDDLLDDEEISVAPIVVVLLLPEPNNNLIGFGCFP